MKINIDILLRWFLYALCSGSFVCTLHAQEVDSTTARLSLDAVITHAKESNRLIGVQKIEEGASQLDLRDAETGALPRIHATAAYQRFSKITVYDGVLGESHQITKPPNANAGLLGIETSFNLYSGGRQQSVIKDLKLKNDLSALNTRELEATISLQAALQYLELVKLYFQQQLIHDQVRRANERAKNIHAFFVNGKVTRSDKLRADLLLSNAQLSETANRNDYRICNQKLNTLLNLEQSRIIIPADTALRGLIDTLAYEQLHQDFSGSFSIAKIQKNIQAQQNREKLTRSFNHPTVALFGGYGFNYPNTFIFPPAAQTLAVGHAGVRINYEISSLYHSRHKIGSIRLRESALQQQKEWIEDNVQHEARSLTIKYKEALHRMRVTKKSIEQAEINYQIQNTKYFNQLGLLTDLLEADNLYQEARFNYIQANIAALSIYYRLLFVVGKL